MNERLQMVLLAGVSVLVYANSLLNGFTMDDEFYIFRNPVVTNLSLSSVFQPVSGNNNVFRPVTFVSLILNWAAGDSHAFGYHLCNLLLHVIVTLLFYMVVRALLESVARGNIVAWVAALIYAVHPLHTEAVASIMGRSELLAAGFLLASWLLHLGDRPVLALVGFLLALLSKESAVAFVPLVIAGDYVRGEWKTFRRYGSIAAVGVAYLAVLWKVQGGRFGEVNIDFLDNPLAHVPLSIRIPNALNIAWKYVWLHIYPINLSCDYSYNAIRLYANYRHIAPAAVGTLLVLALWSWALWTHRKEWVLAGAIYLGAFAVTANVLIPTGTIMAERLAYLPSGGFCILVGLLWVRFEERNRRVAWLLLALVVVALSARTVIRNRDWRDNFDLYEAGVRAAPGSAKLHANLAFQYYYRGQRDEAAQEIQTALRIYPNLPMSTEVKELIEGRREQTQLARGLMENQLAMMTKNDPNYDPIAVSLATALAGMGEDQNALRLLDQEIAAWPKSSWAWSNRAVILYKRGEVDSARSSAETALRLDASNAQAQALIGMMNAARPFLSKP